MEAPQTKSQKYRIDNRWTAELVADGFTPISVYFLENYHSLSPPITHAEAMLIVHLMRYKWSDEAPYPGFKTIAKQMGISPQMARHHARSLAQKKYLHRELQIGATNKFHLKPLFEALSKHRTKVTLTPQPKPPANAPSQKAPPPLAPPLPPGFRPKAKQAIPKR